ncbi:hypothetical protein [Limnobacter sp.]|uniref:hypothetical protein n=1 Tax=Limnobacter sp. TaxID=2003368 RepID=UPI002FE18380
MANNSSPVITFPTGGDIPTGSAESSSTGPIISPVVTSGLVATQVNANFCKVPQQPHVIDMIKECYKMGGKEEISDALNSFIDGLAKKVEAGGGQKADEIKSLIVEILQKVEFTADATVIPVTAHIPPASPVTSLPLATSKETVKATGIWGRFGSWLGGVSKEQAVLQNLQKVAVEEGVPEKLVQYKKELQLAKREEVLKQKITETTAQIKLLPDLDAFKKVLNDVEGGVKLLGKTTLAEKKSLVDTLRKTDLLNRKQDKSVTDQRIQHSTIEAFVSGKKSVPVAGVPADPMRSLVQKLEARLSNKAMDQRAKHDAAIPGYKKLQSQLAESVQNIVIPVLEPQVELNAAKLNALSERITELEKLEKDKLPDLEAKKEVANKADNFDELNSLIDQIMASEKNIKNLDTLKEKIAEIQGSVSAAGVDLSAIRQLSLQFGVTRSSANVLPFNLHMLGNGVESLSVNEGFSLNQALEYGRSGRANNAISRSIALRTHLAEFGSDFNVYENAKNPVVDTVRGDGRSFLSDLGGALRSPDSERADKVLAFLSTKEGRKYTHRLAACNVTAAGFNAKTLQLDAPSLAYKVESGFGALKKLMVGRAGVYARDPGEYVGNRLSVVSRLSSVLQKELFRDGKPVSLEHAVITPQHAVEASSLILAALPNDLLTINHLEVTRFMKSLKEFESEIQSAKEQKQPVSADKQLSFKQALTQFHKDAALWISRRGASDADKSVAVARQISTEIATNGRKGFFRRATISVGNFINLAGGRGIREGWSSLQNYLSQINQKERLRQQLGKPENLAVIADLKRRLLPLANSPNESEVNNAKALNNYLSGKSLTVELKGDLSPQLKKVLLVMGDFLQNAWQPLSKGKSMPAVIGLSASQINSLPNFSSTPLRRFTVGISEDSQATPVTMPVIAAAPAIPVGVRSALFSNQWISSLWGRVLNEGSNPDQQLARLKAEYQEAFQVDLPEGGGLAFSDQQTKAYFKNLESLNEIAVFAGRNVKDIPGPTMEKMKDLTPILLNIKRGAVLQSQLAPLGTRTLQNVSGDKARCWLRSSWGAAVNALSKDEFTKRVGLVAQSMNDELGTRNLTSNEIGQIYDQIKADPLNGLQTKPILEYKQRALMISLMGRADGSWKKGSTLETLNQLKDGENPQTEGDFGVLFLKALDLPVIIHNGTDAIPDVYLPENYKTDQHGHPDTWPTLRYDGTGQAGHWQFYEKPAAA